MAIIPDNTVIGEPDPGLPYRFHEKWVEVACKADDNLAPDTFGALSRADRILHTLKTRESGCGVPDADVSVSLPEKGGRPGRRDVKVLTTPSLSEPITEQPSPPSPEPAPPVPAKMGAYQGVVVFRRGETAEPAGGSSVERDVKALTTPSLFEPITEQPGPPSPEPAPPGPGEWKYIGKGWFVRPYRWAGEPVGRL
ncbi:MAG: hypothetical protein OXF02_06720 [Simkaniaceae bacterium]|nr:hypothetical protein [Simkaniaceae bacterium]